jgi:hypothetical protein
MVLEVALMEFFKRWSRGLVGGSLRTGQRIGFKASDWFEDSTKSAALVRNIET